MVSNSTSAGVCHCLTAYFSVYLACLRMIVCLSVSVCISLSLRLIVCLSFTVCLSLGPNCLSQSQAEPLSLSVSVSFCLSFTVSVSVSVWPASQWNALVGEGGHPRFASDHLVMLLVRHRKEMLASVRLSCSVLGRLF